MKQYFATKVLLGGVKERTVVGNFNPNKWREVQREINSNKVDIDFDCFKKNKLEMRDLKEAKFNHQMNPTKGREEVLGAFISSKIPNWNLTFILLNK